jgi:ABC-2 type transport system ATP-binding protein
MDDAPFLEVRGLTYRYDGKTAVDGVDFDVRQGEILGLLGPNGAGKTTTISCLAGLRRPVSGAMRLHGEPFRPADDAAQRARLGVVPQELALYGNLSGRENLRFFARMSGVAADHLDAAVDGALALAGLAERGDDLVRKYSGGMKRRLNLVCGTLHAPRLLILDEPTVGVDPQSRAHIFDALETLSAGGHTLLYTTHYMEEAERLCDRIAVMDEGRVVAVGTVEELARTANAPGCNLEQVFLALTGKRLRDA